MYRWLLLALALILFLLDAPVPLAVAAVPQPTAPLAAAASCQSTPASTLGNSLTQQSCFAPSTLRALTDLVQTADLIVRGKVTAVHSFWRADQRMIESEVTLAVAYPLLGQAPSRLVIRTAGGYLAAAGLGMMSPHAATFAVDEEVLVFAYRQVDQWQVVQGAAGKFSVQADQVVNSDLAFGQPLQGLLPTLVDLIQQRGALAQVPLVWRHFTAAPAPGSIQPRMAQSSIKQWATPHATAPFWINLNSDQIGTAPNEKAAFRAAILAAATSWSQVTTADFTLHYAGDTQATATSYNGVNEILFMAKGNRERGAAAQVWYTADQTIIEADIWINDDYRWSVTAAPSSQAVDLESALLHEFGHWLVLGHFTDTDTVMYPRLTTGTLKRALQQQDRAGISAIYPP
ncbi:MAG: matrixin family metalloprotease [Caldilineaceae bacterium]|nr:matrixin family metalloprotease [Caldilineaceae bacterium]